MGHTIPDRDSGAHKKKSKIGDCRSGCGAVRVGNYSTVPRHRYCHPTTRLSRADLENHHYSGVVTSSGNGHIPVDDYARRTIIFKRKS